MGRAFNELTTSQTKIQESFQKITKLSISKKPPIFWRSIGGKLQLTIVYYLDPISRRLWEDARGRSDGVTKVDQEGHHRRSRMCFDE